MDPFFFMRIIATTSCSGELYLLLLQASSSLLIRIQCPAAGTIRLHRESAMVGVDCMAGDGYGTPVRIRQHREQDHQQQCLTAIAASRTQELFPNGIGRCGTGTESFRLNA